MACHIICFVSICFVSFCFVSFRFVSFRFDLFRFVPFLFCFVSHCTGTRRKRLYLHFWPSHTLITISESLKWPNFSKGQSFSKNTSFFPFYITSTATVLISRYKVNSIFYIDSFNYEIMLEVLQHISGPSDSKLRTQISILTLLTSVVINIITSSQNSFSVIKYF